MKEVFKFICPQIPLLAENRVFSLLPAICTNMKISEQLGAGKNAMHCNKKRTAVRWASQCSALANSMAWTFYLIGETNSYEDSGI